jgi:cytochrome c-type biogenesis protein CcsB
MAIKWTLLGLLMYGAMGLYLLAAAAFFARARKPGWGLFGAGFVAAVAAFVWRWSQAGHPPLQNLFEVFLGLGMLAFPISVFSRRALGTADEAADAILGVLVLFPAGFVFSVAPHPLPPVLQSPLFVPHVAAYMLAYVILAKAAVPAARRLFSSERGAESGKPCATAGLVRPCDTLTKNISDDAAAYRLVSFGFPLLTLGLVLGAWWGKMAWGDYWNWDPKELWSLAAWLVYLLYFHVRYRFGAAHPRLTAAFVLVGLATIVLTLLWVNLARLFAGLHSYAS